MRRPWPALGCSARNKNNLILGNFMRKKAMLLVFLYYFLSRSFAFKRLCKCFISEGSPSLEYGTTLMDNWITAAFRGNVVHSSSRADTLSRTYRSLKQYHHIPSKRLAPLPIHVASYPRRKKPSAIPLRKPESSSIIVFVTSQQIRTIGFQFPARTNFHLRH
jgi:hypothetical protein